jgi:hypothetical protein
MRYLMMSKTVDNTPDESLYVEMGKFIEEMSAAGVLITTGGLGPDPIRVAKQGSEITVTDGPFAEAKEAVGGFALVEVSSKEEAIEIARRFLGIVGDGESVIQEVFAP